jgi:ectoine hydroxylase-related dioxygenase (phytanoyl-CoA dioxygenase family)
VRFYSGSHRLGVLGWVFADGISLEERCQDMLKDCPLSPARPMKAGDATVHHSLTVHGALANSTNTIRWARSMVYIDADARQKIPPDGLPAGVPVKSAAVFDNPECPVVPAG